MSCEEEIEECDSEEVAVMGVKRKSYRRRKSDSDHSRHSGFLRHDSKPGLAIQWKIKLTLHLLRVHE